MCGNCPLEALFQIKFFDIFIIFSLFKRGGCTASVCEWLQNVMVDSFRSSHLLVSVLVIISSGRSVAPLWHHNGVTLNHENPQDDSNRKTQLVRCRHFYILSAPNALKGSKLLNSPNNIWLYHLVNILVLRTWLLVEVLPAFKESKTIRHARVGHFTNTMIYTVNWKIPTANRMSCHNPALIVIVLGDYRPISSIDLWITSRYFSWLFAHLWSFTTI